MPGRCHLTDPRPFTAAWRFSSRESCVVCSGTLIRSGAGFCTCRCNSSALARGIRMTRRLSTDILISCLLKCRSLGVGYKNYSTFCAMVPLGDVGDARRLRRTDSLCSTRSFGLRFDIDCDFTGARSVQDVAGPCDFFASSVNR